MPTRRCSSRGRRSADSVTELFAARSMVYETARGLDDDGDVKLAHARCSMVKLFASEMANRVAKRGVHTIVWLGGRAERGGIQTKSGKAP